MFKLLKTIHYNGKEYNLYDLSSPTMDISTIKTERKLTVDNPIITLDIVASLGEHTHTCSFTRMLNTRLRSESSKGIDKSRKIEELVTNVNYVTIAEDSLLRMIKNTYVKFNEEYRIAHKNMIKDEFCHSVYNDETYKELKTQILELENKLKMHVESLRESYNFDGIENKILVPYDMIRSF